MPALLFPVGVQTVAESQSATDNYTREYSGVVIDQNVTPEANTDYVSPSAYVYQTFTLPSDYERGGDFIPSLTGLQVYTGIDSGSAATARIDWTLDHYIDNQGWTNLGAGTAIGAALDGDELWQSIYFDSPLTLEADWLADRFRFGIRGSQGVNRFWYTVPNPLATTFDKAYIDITPVQDNSRDTSLMFRVLADIADSGVDFLGNVYRSAVRRNSTSVVTTGDGRDRDTYWTSAPQPSQFAVVNQYFDVSDFDDAVVIDGVMVDPTTPGVYFHVYYSSDPSGPGTDTDAWDNLLWKPIPTAFRLTNRTNYIFPKPVLAKYIKIEYSHLQARYYAPGNFQKPITYKKHPKWVTDYFLARILAKNTEDPLVARRVQVIYDALDFAFNYYRDDLSLEPTAPLTVDQLVTNLKIQDVNEEQVDPQTLAKIRVAFQPYINQPALLARSDYLLGSTLLGQDTSQDYPSEEIDRTRVLPEEVISLEREPVIVEKSYPVMFFYVESRHGYRVAQTSFDYDRAYFVGVNEVAFLREHYDARTDSSLYIETAGDLVNVQRNDFETVDFSWVTYRDR